MVHHAPQAAAAAAGNIVSTSYVYMLAPLTNTPQCTQCNAKCDAVHSLAATCSIAVLCGAEGMPRTYNGQCVVWYKYNRVGHGATHVCMRVMMDAATMG